MNGIWFFLLIVAFGFAALGGKVGEFTSGLFEATQKGVDVSLSLVGMMVFWLGLMKIAEKSGLVDLIARAVQPVLGLLFPDVPKGHKAISAIALNIAANALGLDNAATPLGIKAMEELETLNRKVGVLTDSQALLVAMNTAGMTIVPVTVINLRLVEHSRDPYEIVVPTMVATLLSMAAAVAITKVLQRTRRYRDQYESAPDKPALAMPGPRT